MQSSHSPQSFMFLESVTLMLQLSDLRISDDSKLVLCAATFIGVIGTIAHAYIFKSRSRLPLPPSPPSWKLWGHVIPHRRSFLTVTRWIEEYGPLVTIRLGTRKIVYIGRYKAAVDIMEKQGRLSVDRPRQIAAGEILSGEQSVAFTHSGDRFRRMRRALHAHLSPKAADTYQPLQMSHVKNAFFAILDDPDNFQNHVLAFAATTIMKVAYGKITPTSASDEEVKYVRQRFVALSKAMHPGSYLVDLIPWLKYLPWYGRDLRMEFETVRRFYTDQLNLVKQQITNKEIIGPSFAKYILENNHLYGFTETELAFLPGGFIVAGMHSIAVSICAMLMAAACFPEEQAKVQAELDAVIGRHQAPTFVDEQSLPRLHAFISEVHRWRPVAPEGVAHRTTEDIIWENYCIPAGTTVIGNHWAISRDPDVFPEPDAFKPQRWIDDEGRLKDDLKFYAFGFGRRACPGQHLAQRAVFIHTLLILWSFNLTLDPTKPVDDTAYMNSVVPYDRQCPIEFKTRIPETDLRRMMQNYPEPA